MDSVLEKRKPGIYVAWKTVTYRSVALVLLGLALIFAATLYFVFPQITEAGLKTVHRVLERIAGAAPGPQKTPTGTAQQAHFTALDGTVRIKKSSSNSWMTADYGVPLDKGDVVQTGAEGMAKIAFNDGTNYTVKQDSLIVIEENSANDQQQTNVALSTWPPLPTCRARSRKSS